MPQQFNDVVIFANRTKFLIRPEENSDTIDSVATPIISNLTFIRGSGSVVTITNFIGGADCQSLSILGDGTTTIQHGTNIFTNTGANKLLAANKVYRFTYDASAMKWYEDA